MTVRSKNSLVLGLLIVAAATMEASPPDASIVCRATEQPPCVNSDGFWGDLPIPEQAHLLTENMSDSELLGQVLALGYHGTGFPEDLREWIQDRHLGNVKIFSRNVDSLRELTEAIRGMQLAARGSRLQIPLFVITDQEGGWVRHVKGRTSQTPGNLALGASRIPDDAYQTGRFIGEELRLLGINMNLAPVVDVYSHPEATVIGPRSFSSEPITTGLLSIAFFHGLSASGVIPVAKHYPGHGAAAGDSHGIFPEAIVDLSTLWDRDLVPYRFLVREGIQAIMNAHVGYPLIIDDSIPASLSPFFLQKVLREQLNFRGLVISDDLEMRGALNTTPDTSAATVAAIRAGNDIVLISHTPTSQLRAWHLLHRHMSDQQFRGRVKEAVQRVLTVKLRAFRSRLAVPLFPVPDSTSSIPTDGADVFFLDSAARSVTEIRSSSIPFQPDKTVRVLLVGQSDEFLAEGLLRFPEADVYRFPYTPFYSARQSDLDKIQQLAGNYDAIIYLLMNYNSAEILTNLSPYSSRILVVSALNPIYLANLPWIETAVAVYGTNRESYRAGFAVLSGDYHAEGKLPIDLRLTVPST